MDIRVDIFVVGMDVFVLFLVEMSGKVVVFVERGEIVR